MKLVEVISIGVFAIGWIASMWMLQDNQDEIHNIKTTMLNERIEHLRLKTALAIIGIEDVVEIKNNTAVEIIWIRKP